MKTYRMYANGEICEQCDDNYYDYLNNNKRYVTYELEDETVNDLKLGIPQELIDHIGGES